MNEPGQGSDGAFASVVRRFRLKLSAIAALIILAVATHVILELLRERDHQLDEGHRQARALSQSLAEQTGRLFSGIEVMLDLAGHLPAHGPVGTERQSDQVQTELRDLTRLLPEVREIAVLSPDGAVLHASTAYPNAVLNAFDGAHLRAAINGSATGLKLGEPAENRLSGDFVLPVSKPIRDQDGTLRYIAVALIDTDSLRDTFAAMPLREGSAVLLARSDGVVIVRQPDNSTSGTSFAGRPLFSSYLASAPRGSFVSPAQSDGEVRVVGYQLLADFDLALAVALHRSELLASWREAAFLDSVFALIVVVAVLFGGRILLQGFAREVRLREAAVTAGAQADRQAVRQQVVAGLGQYAFETGDHEEFFERVAEAISRATGGDFATLVRAESSGEHVRVLAAAGWPDPGIVGFLLPAGPGSHTGFTIETGQTVVAGDYETEARFTWHKVLRDHGVHSGIAVPVLQTGRQPNVCLHVLSTRKNAFSDDDIHFMESIAHLLAVRLDRRVQHSLRDAALDSVPGLLCVVDGDGRIILVNEQWRAHARDNGLDHPEFGLGTSYLDVCKAAMRSGVPDAERIHDGMISVLRTGARSFEFEYRCETRDGPHWFQCFVSPVDLDGETGALVTHIDITVRKSMESQLREAHRMEALGQLTGGIAHDFNNLLTVIVGNSEMLADRIPDGTIDRRMLDGVRQAADRGAELTDRLLSYARRQRLDPGVVDLTELFGEITGLLARTLREDITLEVDAANERCLAYADPTRLHTALMNLVFNARDAMPNGGTIKLSCELLPLTANHEAAAPFVRITVADTGEGMSEEVARRAFEPFFTTKSVGKGTGLGLSMVHGFAIQSGGQVRIESTPGKGTRVSIDIPASADNPSELKGDTLEYIGDRLRGMTALVVEDDDRVLDYIRLLLDDFGLAVCEARDGTEALRILSSHVDFDIVLSDVIMPGEVSGYDLATAAHKLRPGLPMILMSGYADPGMIEKLSGFDREIPLLRKPFTRRALAATMASVLRDRA